MRSRELLWRLLLPSLGTTLLLLTGCGGGGSSISTPPPIPPTLSITNSGSLPNALPGVAYTTTVHATGGTGTLTWSVLAGSTLPSWLNLNSSSGVLSGTPTSPENRGFTLQVTDSGSPHQTSTANYILLVLQPIFINSAFLGPANKGIPYNSSITAVGGTNSITLSVSAGNFPPGLQLASDGRITGTPTQGGTFQFTVKGVDAGPPQQTGTADVTMQVQSTLQIVPTTLLPAIQGRNYSQTLQAVNGTLPLHWSATLLPTGLAIDSSTGTISGTPTQLFPADPNITVTDSSIPAQTYTFSQTIQVFAQLQILSTDLGSVVLNQGGFVIVQFSGGVPPVTMQMLSSPSSGVTAQVVGTELIVNGTQLGDYSFNLKLTDGATPPQTAQDTFTLHVVPLPPIITTTTLPRGIVGRTYSFGLAAQRGTPPFDWTISSGSLPAGLMLDSQGLIHGTPTAAGTSQFIVHLADSGAPAQTANANLSLQVLAHALGRNDSIATATPVISSMLPISATISPFFDPSTNAPDGDYYRLTANPGTTVSVAIVAKRLFVGSMLDSVVEIVDGTGTRFTTCNDPIQQFLTAPAVLDPNPTDFNNPCINDDDPNSNSTDSSLQFKVPGTSGPPVTFYIHVIDFRGDARPDMIYQLQVSGAN